MDRQIDFQCREKIRHLDEDVFFFKGAMVFASLLIFDLLIHGYTVISMLVAAVLALVIHRWISAFRSLKAYHEELKKTEVSSCENH
jgi:hypothetical protein